MSTVYVMRGLPASGKTTDARLIVETTRAVRVSRDDLRQTLEGKDFLDHEGEHTVTVLEEAMVEAALKAGKSVVIDATHLRPRYVTKWAKVAARHGAAFEVIEKVISLEESRHRNRRRENSGERFVPGEAIEKMGRYLKNRQTGELLPVDLSSLEQPAIRKYEPRPDRPAAIIVDIDGTLAHMDNRRSPYDLDKVGLDRLDRNVSDVIDALYPTTRVILLSGREDSARDETVRWLTKHGVSYDELYMRAANDKRKDSIVKAELFDRYVRDDCDVQFVLDDRNQVVQMWRDMGLVCWQVAEGNF